jgi:hypothetical protein
MSKVSESCYRLYGFALNIASYLLPCLLTRCHPQPQPANSLVNCMISPPTLLTTVIDRASRVTRRLSLTMAPNPATD